MRQSFKFPWLNLFCISLVIFLIIFNLNSFITGPTNIYAAQDREVLNNMLDKNMFIYGELIARYSYDQVYYVAKIAVELADELVWFDVNGSILFTTTWDSYQPTAVLALANASFNLSEARVSLGMYRQRPVYIISSPTLELRYDYVSKKLLSSYQKAVSL